MSKEELRKKLREKMDQSKLKRSSGDSKRSFLEKNKVPENMMDHCMKAMNSASGAQVVQMMKQLQNMPRPQADIVREEVKTEAKETEMKPPNMEQLQKMVSSMPETAKALLDAMKGTF